jgi:hypothetical protein
MQSVVFAVITVISLTFASTSTRALAEDTEERFHDLFITAGYATAFGAALGTAVLGLAPDPGQKMHYIYAGASLGFIGGSILGSYVIFSPMFADTYDLIGPGRPIASITSDRRSKIVIRPLFDPRSRNLTGAGAIWNIATF